MRASVDKNDPGYSPEASEFKAYLDGVYVSNVITADEEQNYLIRYCTDEDGALILDGFGEYLTEKHIGNISISIPERICEHEGAVFREHLCAYRCPRCGKVFPLHKYRMR